MARKKTTTAVAKRAATDVAAYAGYEAEAGGGFEHTDQDAFLVPRLTILHKQSPQCNEHEETYVPGARQGAVYNTATQELISTPFRVVPFGYERVWLEWQDREEGGGLIDVHRVKPENVEGEFGHERVNGHHLGDTRNHFVIYEHPETGVAEPAVISMVSSQIKKSRAWMTMMRRLTSQTEGGVRFSVPMWGSWYVLETVHEKNALGDWAGWKITRHDGVPADGSVAEAVRDLRVPLEDGKLGTSYERDDAATDDVPF